MQISGRFFMSNGGSLRAAVATLSISIPFGFSATALAQEAVQSIEGTTSAPPRLSRSRFATPASWPPALVTELKQSFASIRLSKAAIRYGPIRSE